MNGKGSTRLKIIIPTCGNKCLLDMLCGFLNLPHDRPELEFVLVMNGGGLEEQVTFEAARDWLVQYFRCRYIYLPERCGYFRAIEWGWNLAELQPDDYVAGLNDDVEISGDWITPLVEALERHPNAQVGPYSPYLGADGLGYQTPGRGVYRYIDGCCWMARAETITRAGGIIDHGLKGAYCGDCDLSIRIVESGGILQQVPVPVRHIGHGSNGPETQANWAKNRKYLASKWDLVNGGPRKFGVSLEETLEW